VSNLFPVVCTEDVAACSRFYQRLLGLKPVFEADWYAQLQSPSDPAVEIAFVKRDHSSVPEGHQQAPAGVIVTLECDDVDAVHARARADGLPIELTLRDEDWGQRHFMTRDPSGLLLDVVKVIPASDEHAEGYAVE
jgi:catechol 2,3-dioxygenase-like lactoylglutathione lyase family enzyme